MDVDREKIVVMRIKRKATEPPLSALVISDDAQGGSGTGYSTPKKRRDVSGRARGVFRLADTVPDSWVGKGLEGEALKQRIETLIKRQKEQGAGALSQGEQEELRAGLGVAAAANHAAGTGIPGAVDQDREVKGNKRLSDSTEAIAAPAGPSKSSGASRDADRGAAPAPRLRTPPKRKESSGPTHTQYRIVPPPRPAKANGLPPRLLNHAELEAAARSHFRFVDAQAVHSAKSATQAPIESPAEADPQMAAFQSMLSEYLKLGEGSQQQKEEEDEYVYDLYYRDLRELGVGGTGADVGALLGYDDFSPPSTPSDSEPEDEADEDSNDEDFYRNDYPEDEDADEDMEGYEDAFANEEDADYYSDEASSDRDPGTWDYR